MTWQKRRENSNLHNAMADKTDEFYTQLSLIESELKHYKEHFKDKVVFAFVMTLLKVIFLNVLQSISIL